MLGVLGDGAARRYESGRLLDRVAAAQASLTYTERRLAGTVEYVSPQLSSPDAPAAVRQSLRDVVQAEAADRLPVLAARRDAVARVRLLPWHRAERRARTDYLGYLDLRLVGLRAAATDLDALYQRQTELEPSRERARTSLRKLDATAADELLG